MGHPGHLKLGLIGDNIAQSKAPMLHRLAGEQHGIEVTYDRLVPSVLGQSFDGVFDACPLQGYRGLNITYPYKEKAAGKVKIDDPLVEAMGAVNTVLFEPKGAVGFNTDYTGFIDAYPVAKGEQPPGVTAVIGTGGVGRALAFALVALGAREVRLFDRDNSKALRLADDLARIEQGSRVYVCHQVSDAIDGATGLLNGTPIGMVGYDGTPLPRSDMTGAEWVFDAIYTPLETEFLRDARGEGLQCINGYELFIHQGLACWKLFSGFAAMEADLRASLANASQA